MADEPRRIFHDLVSPGERWGVDAELVVCWPPGQPLLWQNPHRVSGARCVFGTRLPAATPLEAFAEGVDPEEIAEDWPSAPPAVLRRLVGLCAYLLEGSIVEDADRHSAASTEAMLDRRHLNAGQTAYAIDTEDGILITPYDPTFAKAMEIAERGAKKYKNALRELSK